MAPHPVDKKTVSAPSGIEKPVQAERTPPTPEDASDDDLGERTSLLGEFWDFIKHEKKWWLAPLILILALVGALLVFAGSSPAAPFIYTFF